MAKRPPFVITLDGKKVDPKIMPAIDAIASEFPGDRRIEIDVGSGRRITLGTHVTPTPDFAAALARLMQTYAR